jgi:microcystin-dependent protein
MKKLSSLFYAVACCGLFTAAGPALAQGTAFTLQGQLINAGVPASGNYDLQCALFTNLIQGSQYGPSVTVSNVAVSAGLFTTILDFGTGVYNGTNYWLDIAVRTNGGSAFSELSPRQPLTPTPYAVFAGGASNIAGVLSSGALSGNYPGAVTFPNAANSFSGNGGGLTGLNASQLTTGTVPLAQLPGGLVTNNAGGVSLSGTFTGNGGGLTNLSISQSSLSSVVTNNETGVTLGGTFRGNGSALTNLSISQSLPSNVVTNTETGLTLSGTFSGIGAGLSALNASQLTSGTVPLAQLPGGVIVNNATGVTLNGTFGGNGGGLTNLSVSQALPSSVVTNTATGVSLNGAFSGDGSGLTNLNASSLVSNILNALCPPGTVVAYMGTNAPPGWLLCDGSPVSRTQYAGLFGVILISSGVGDGVTTFNLPDLRGMFLRGVNGSESDTNFWDPDAALRTNRFLGGNVGNTVGSVQQDQFRSHTHTYEGGGSQVNPGNPPAAGSGYPSGSYPTSSAGGHETRPINTYVNYIIKY